MRIIAGTHKNRLLVSPKGSQTRPTASRLRETLFNICQSYIEGCHFLDLFAGSGAIGFEALSRGAASCSFVDNDKESFKCLQANASLFEGSKIALFCNDAFVALKKIVSLKKRFDIIYADPPYDKWSNQGDDHLSLSSQVLMTIDGQDLLNEGGELFIEDLSTTIPHIDGLHNLQLISRRSAGRATLFQFRKLDS